jgi:hypothetical protein
VLAVVATIRHLHGANLDDPDHREPDDLELVLLRAADLLEAAQALADTYAEAVHAAHTIRSSR